MAKAARLLLKGTIGPGNAQRAVLSSGCCNNIFCSCNHHSFATAGERIQL